MTPYFLCYTLEKGGLMTEEEVKEQIEKELEISNKIKDNTAEWKRTKSISVATSTMELLVEILDGLGDGKD